VKVSMGSLGTSDLTVSIAQAIYQMEGSGPSTIATRNNNPGNLRSGVGQTGSNGGYAVFPDMATGWAALYHQIDLNISRGLTLYEFFGGNLATGGTYQGYAPSADSNDPINYANVVASRTGIDPSVPLNQLGATGGIDSSGVDPGMSDPGTFGVIDTTSLLIIAGVGIGAILLVGALR